MRKEKAVKRKKKQQLFHPDEIAMAISRALKLDFSEAQHVYCLNDDITLHAFNRQVNGLLKKYVGETVEKDELDVPTFEKFRRVNEHMAKVRKDLKGSFPTATKIHKSMPEMDKIHIRARCLMHRILGPFSVSEWFLKCKNSGGSSIGVAYMDTSQDAKFTFPMTGTKDAVSLFKQAMLYDNNLRREIEDHNKVSDKHPNVCMDGWFEITTESSAMTVDKNAEINRFISKEATVNMFLQQGLMLMIYDLMAKAGLDVKTLPDYHQLLAKLSSISQKNATIDWATASDCGSYELYEWLTPPVWFRYFDMTRSTHTLVQGERVELNMFSTMGNAVTFPLETLTFWTYAAATLFTVENPMTNSVHVDFSDQQRVSVFGDDCIVPTSIAPKYIEVMKSVGFIVNDEKSYFSDEQFRESCGGDFLAGYDVRPFSLKAPQTVKRSSCEPWLYILTNALLTKYIKYFGELSYVYDKELWRTIFGLFRKYKISIKLVPTYFPDDAGLKLNGDVSRFQRYYGLKLNPIARSQHGTYAFQYLRFVFRKREVCHDGLQLALWYRNPGRSEARRIECRPGEDWDGSDSPIVHDRKIRKKGGYVVANGISCHWHLPVSNPAS